MKVTIKVLLFILITTHLLYPCTVLAAEKSNTTTKDKTKSLPKRFKKENVLFIGSAGLLVLYLLVRIKHKPYIEFTHKNMNVWEHYVSNDMLEEWFKMKKGSISALNRSAFLKLLQEDLYRSDRTKTNQQIIHIRTKVEELEIKFNTAPTTVCDIRKANQSPITPPSSTKPTPSSPSVIEKCKICDEVKDNFTALSCTHMYCRDCLAEAFDVAMKEKKTTEILRCPEPKCKKQIQEQDIRKIIKNDHAKMDAYNNVTAKEALALMKDAQHCPVPDCDYVFLHDTKHPERVTCPNCSYSYCSNCLFVHPSTTTCEKAKLNRKSDLSSAQWIKEHTKPCPKCNARIEKNNGCEHMTCQKCTHEFWWCCLKNYNNGLGHSHHSN